MAGESIAASKITDKSIGSAGVCMVESVSILDTSVGLHPQMFDIDIFIRKFLLFISEQILLRTTTTVFKNADTELTITQTTAKSARAPANGSGTYVLKQGSPLVTISEGAVAISGGGLTVQFTPSTKGQQSFSVTTTADQMAAFTVPEAEPPTGPV
jgi:hypothetical protein